MLQNPYEWNTQHLSVQVHSPTQLSMAVGPWGLSVTVISHLDNLDSRHQIKEMQR